MSVAELRLNLPWVPREPEQLSGLTVRRGRKSMLSYEDGVALEVRVVDPGQQSMEQALDAVHLQEGPG